MNAKAVEYLRAGVQLIWVVWFNSRTIDVWMPTSPTRPFAVLSPTDILDGGQVIPGFQCPVSAFFEV